MMIGLPPTLSYRFVPSTDGKWHITFLGERTTLCHMPVIIAEDASPQLRVEGEMACPYCTGRIYQLVSIGYEEN